MCVVVRWIGTKASNLKKAPTGSLPTRNGSRNRAAVVEEHLARSLTPKSCSGTGTYLAEVEQLVGITHHLEQEHLYPTPVGVGDDETFGVGCR
jgi:hypothetical protein